MIGSFTYCSIKSEGIDVADQVPPWKGVNYGRPTGSLRSLPSTAFALDGEFLLKIVHL